MEKLPVTSYVRLVDIWLIFGQLIPFIEVISYLISLGIANQVCFYQGGFVYNS